jgi:hypothetical protein|tara:strand:- start:113 stop:313 length:201 start_codon:yes stop_codon:yes gene_type:complete
MNQFFKEALVQLQLLNEKNLAKQLDLTVAKLRRDRFEKRGLPYSKINRSVRYDLEKVKKFLEENSV